MTKRWMVSSELTDGTCCVDPVYLDRKDIALKVAGAIAKSHPWDVVRVWVDDTTTDCGVKSFKVGA